MNLQAEFVARLNEQFGSEATGLIEALTETPNVSVRIQPEKIDHRLRLDPVPWTRHGYYLNERPAFTLDPLFHAGCYYVQEASSMLLEQAVEKIQSEEKVLTALDLCAAPGGKTTHLMSLLLKECVLVSNEVIRSRVGALVENVTKWSGENVVVTNNDPSDFSHLKEMFDLVVVDAPCSGEGLFRKEPKSLSQWSQANLELNAQRQRRILRDILPSIRTGGHLIYSTCTFNPAENQEVVDWLATEFGMESVEIDLDDSWGFVRTSDDQNFGWQALPHRVRGEGFFLAVLRKNTPDSSPARSSSSKKSKNRRTKRNKSCESCVTTDKNPVDESFALATRRDRDELGDWISGNTDDLTIVTDGSEYRLLTSALADWLFSYCENLRVVTSGVRLARKTRQGFVPEHGFAVSKRLRNGSFPIVEVDGSSAIQYLRRESIDTDLLNGIGLVSYKGHHLGWLKQVGDRSNNRYPKNWRIRMQADRAENALPIEL